MRNARPGTRQCLATAVTAALMLSGATAVAADTVRIKVDDLAFDPAEVSVRVGDTIEWINKDFVDHTATEQRGQWDVALPSDASRRLLARKAGTFAYFCRFHPHMKGVIHVGIP